MRQWRTPMTADDGRKVTAVCHQVQLKNQAEQWPTPEAGQFGTADVPRLLDRRVKYQEKYGNNGFGLTLGQTVAVMTYRSSPPDPTTPAGPPSSPERRSLNPRFVEWLMGWPIGWTSFACAETGLSPWLQRSRGALSTLLSRPTQQQGNLL
jgi:hypothetical protein